MATHGTLIWLKQPGKRPQPATQPATAAGAANQRDTRMNSRQRRSAERLRAFQQHKRAAVEPAGTQREPQPPSQPETGGGEATNASQNAATRSSSDAIAAAGAAANSGSTAAVAAPHPAAAAQDVEQHTNERTGLEPSSGEPSESGEIPLMELTMVQRAEVRQGKRAREPAVVLLDPAWGVCRIKEELMTRGLCTSGLKRDLVVRLAAAMVSEGAEEREEARPRIGMRGR